MTLEAKLELVLRCMSLITKHGVGKEKDTLNSLCYEVENHRIAASRWHDDIMEFHLSLSTKPGYTIFSVTARPLINIEEIAAQQWPEPQANDILMRLRTMMVLDDLAAI